MTKSETRLSPKTLASTGMSLKPATVTEGWKIGACNTNLGQTSRVHGLYTDKFMMLEYHISSGPS